MNGIVLIFQNKTLRILISVLFAIGLVIVGFELGRNSSLNYMSNKVPLIDSKCNGQIQDLNDELSAVLNDQAQLLTTSRQIYNRDEIGIYSNLFEGKQVEISSYKYRTKNIIRKRIVIDDYSGVELWEYASEYPAGDELKDFAIFRGYENYANHAILVNDIVSGWADKYKTKLGVEMFYGHEYTPKSIGVVTLESYHRYLPNFVNSKPTFIKIWYSKMGGFPSTKEDPLVIKAKVELNKIADSIELGLPDSP